MLEEKLLADFEVMTSDKKLLKAYKCILATRSHFFYELLSSSMTDDVAKVPEDAATMEAVLRFIYCGEVENLDAIALELVFVALKYQLVELKELCVESLAKTLSCENAVETLSTAEGLTDSKKLKEKCFDFIARYA